MISLLVHTSVNYMNKQQLIKLRRLASLVGDFIRYWGFRRIHGQIWTVIYLSRQELSGAELGEILKVSKALISPALKELVKEGLIFQVDSQDAKTKRYGAVEDIENVIRRVLDRREKPMVTQIELAFADLQKTSNSKDFNPNHIQVMQSMVSYARMGLELIVNSEDFTINENSPKG